ncbi:S-layer homology domain-containing protein [Alkalihalophilus marmarensis]|uniref:S-layer homology domain-containing protein n=1 Tax=Alkalihalophilus marmarensis TaxID=521377 RepID=UPI0013798384|nr:S-layer homology domain-containing protein [Alkalihalophilus marmarensis]
MKRFLSKIVLVALAASLVMPVEAYSYSGFGTKQSEKKEEIAAGVSLNQEKYLSGTVNRAVQVLDISYNQPSLSLELYHPNPLGARQTTLQQALANTYEGHYVAGAVNAGYIPMNMIVKNNEIIHYGARSEDPNGPVYHRAAFGVNKSGKPMVSEYQGATVSYNGKTLTPDTLNGTRDEGFMVVYTPNAGAATTGTNRWGHEIVVENTGNQIDKLLLGDIFTGTVSKITRFNEPGNSTIPKDGFVLSIQSQHLPSDLAGIKSGDKVTFTIPRNEAWQDAEFMLATGPTLLRNGQVQISMNDRSPFAAYRAPRTAVGVSKDQSKLYFVTIDGRQPGYSDGATLPELANYMKSIGAHDAINLDGGGSTTMVARLPYAQQVTTINRPSDGNLRSIPTTLQIVTTEPPKEFVVKDASLVIDSFDSVNDWSAAAARATASIAASTSPRRVGNGALKLTYDYTAGEAGTAAAYVKAKTPKALKGKPLEIGMWAYGNGEEHWLRGNIIDGKGQRHTINFTAENQFNWSGWRYVRAEIPANLSAPIQLEQVYIAQANASKQSMGTVYFDQLEAIYQSSYTVERFSDVPSSHWAQPAIMKLNDQNVINGFTDGSFRPSEKITREQTAVMIARALNLPLRSQPIAFTDVTSNSYASEAIAAVYDAEIMTGKSTARFAPKDLLTRAEMAVVLQRAFDIQGASSEPFKDVPESHWAYKEIDALKANDISVGTPGVGFAPSSSTSRAELAVFLDRVMNER